MQKRWPHKRGSTVYDHYMFWFSLLVDRPALRWGHGSGGAADEQPARKARRYLAQSAHAVYTRARKRR